MKNYYIYALQKAGTAPLPGDSKAYVILFAPIILFLLVLVQYTMWACTMHKAFILLLDTVTAHPVPSKRTLVKKNKKTNKTHETKQKQGQG